MVTNKNLRWESLDFVRGVAIVAMVIFHFIYDLQYFGFYIVSSYNEYIGLRIYSMTVASTFILISGLSLQFWHINKKIDLKDYLKRCLMILGAATLISAYSFITTKDTFIYIGILHLLGICSLLFLLIRDLKNRWILILMSILAWISFTDLLVLPDHRIFAWIGLSENPPSTLDYYPLLPWFMIFLAGTLFVRYANSFIVKRINKAKPYPSRLGNILILVGRKSLLIYLIHQPIFFALFYAYIYIAF